MKYTVLQMVQRILSAIDGDEVNSITDTVEAEQAAFILQRTYYSIVSDFNLPEHETIFSLDASTDNTKPTTMTLPSKIIELNWLRYDVREDGDLKANWREIPYCPLEEFIERSRAFEGETDTTTGSMNITTASGTFEFLYRNNKHPSYYTTLGDDTFIFDSHDNTSDTVLQESKTMCFGRAYADFTLGDNFTPDLDATQFSYLLEAAIQKASVEMKQQDNPEARFEARQQKVSGQKYKRNLNNRPELSRVARFGRK